MNYKCHNTYENAQWIRGFAAMHILLRALLREEQKPCKDLGRCFILDMESNSSNFFCPNKDQGSTIFFYKYVQLVSPKTWALVSGLSLGKARVLLEHYSLEDHSTIMIKLHDLQVRLL